jgi:hypothetical protein
MADSEKMSLQERNKYLRMMQERYREHGWAGEGKLLDETEAVPSASKELDPPAELRHPMQATER